MSMPCARRPFPARDEHLGFRIIRSDLREIEPVQEEVEQFLRRHLFQPREIYLIKLTLEEALCNAIKHGNRMDGGKSVAVLYHIRPDRFEVSVEDEGPGFNPEAVPDPLAEENLDKPSGRGLLLMRSYMSAVFIHPPGNSLTLSLVRTFPDSH